MTRSRFDLLTSQSSTRQCPCSHQISGEAGTLVLWHNKLVHSSGVNQTPNARLAGFNRMSRDDFDDIKVDAKDKPFEYWDGLADLELDIQT
jgi:ectoine hydroxylase-related dioxygenase (phytanoyl-CoA dioxygenase family)